ncbi:MAG: 2-hydroxychromene-2-carboxylate isomerase [Rhodospirillaceae bacterium]|nr:2-hydroxychromene-2-carboxylate isomerase [Rhodospirillaceae bacterium]
MRANWYFDFVSPYAYLQSKLLHKFEGRAEIRMVPVLFAGLLGHWGNVGPAEFPPKRLATYRFCTWFARDRGIPFRFPPRHPFNPLQPLRLALALGAEPRKVHTIFDFIWGEGRDPSDPVEWLALGMRLGLADPDAEAGRPDVKDALRANTQHAIAAGVFGVPTLVIGREAFWGVDATDFALQYLDNPRLLQDEAYLRLADLPSGAERRR